MPFIRDDKGGTSSNETICYPIDTIRTVAATILGNIDLALIKHEDAWNKAQNYVYSLPDPLQSAFMDALNKHQQRIRDSYQWQQDFANALFSAADAAEGAENSNTTAFQTLQGKQYQGFEHVHGHIQ